MPFQAQIEEIEIPITILNWVLALLPIIVLLVLLAVLRWRAPEAGPIGMFTAAIIALLAFRTPFETLAIAGAKGVWEAIFILYVVWPALLLYRVTERAGAFDALRHGIQQFSRNDLFLVLAFGWVFASFLQGIAGFGTPIAVVAPLLLVLGVKPVYAVAIPLIGHAWANMFGTLAVGWLATLAVVDLQDPTTTAFQTAILLWILNIMGGLAIAWLFGRWAAIRHAWPMILIITIVHGGGQLVLTLWDPVLSNFFAATAALAVVYPLSRWDRYAEESDIEEQHVMEDRSERDAGKEQEGEPIMGLGMAILPYIVLTLASILGLVISPIEEFLSQFEVGLPFPAATTGFNVQIEAEDPYSPFAPLTHPGTFLLISALAGWLVYRAKGYYQKWAERTEEKGSIGAALVEDAVPSSVAIVAFLAMSIIMDHSGQTTVLAAGIAAVAPPAVYAFFANWIGVLGAFMTSSNTASNVLFAPLQQTVSDIEGIPEAAIIGAQSAGGANGNAIAPANVVLGTGSAGVIGQEGEVLRKTLVWSAMVAVLVGIGTILLI
ncbi:MAG TPA: L-lactate permease [Chloroflexi bacterium]|jgi:lactate permease|nr:L-lactate permease [Chloroflexota bacterium]